MRRAVRRQPHRLAEPLLRPVRQHRSGDQRIEAADAPVIAPLDLVRAVGAEVIERLRVQPRAERIDDEHGRLVERRRIERRRGMPVVVIDDANALARIAQAQLEVVVFELAVAGPAVQPARKPRVVGVDEVDLLERLQPERLEAVLNAAQRKRVGVLRPRQAILADRHVGDLAAAARHANQRRAGFVVGEVRNTQDIACIPPMTSAGQSSKSERSLVAQCATLA